MFYILMGLVVLCVSGLIFGATMLVRGDSDQIEDRLQALTKNGGRGATPSEGANASVLKSPLDDVPNAIEEFVGKFLNLKRWLEQSGLALTPPLLESLDDGSLGLCWSTSSETASIHLATPN